MFRVANLRHTSMVEAEFRVILSRDERVREGDTVRRFYPLKVYPSRMISFPAALVIRHLIDEESPLFGETLESLENSDAFFLASTVSIELVMAASVQSQKDYSWRDFRFGERFVEIYTETGEGRLTDEPHGVGLAELGELLFRHHALHPPGSLCTNEDELAVDLEDIPRPCVQLPGGVSASVQ